MSHLADAMLERVGGRSGQGRGKATPEYRVVLALGGPQRGFLGEGSQFDVGLRYPAVEADTPPCHPDVVQKDLGWAPIGDPAKNNKALSQGLCSRRIREDPAQQLGNEYARR